MTGPRRQGGPCVARWQERSGKVSLTMMQGLRPTIWVSRRPIMRNTMNFAQNARLALVLLAGASLAACATPRYPSHVGGPQAGAPAPGQGGYKVGAPYQVAGVWYVPKEDPNYDKTGVASWYGDEFHQKATANGETFDMNAVSAAHTTLPLPSMVEVTNLDNGKTLTVRVNDRGPFVGNRLIDLSREAARQLGYDRAGLANVRVRYVGPAPLLGPDAGVRYASSKPLPTRLAANTVTAPPRAAMAYARPDPVLASTSAATAPPLSANPIAEAPLTPARPPVAVTTQRLAPLIGAEISSAPIGSPLPPVATAPAPTSQVLATATTTSPLRVQAGAFSSEVNAQRAVSALSGTGPASIERVERDGLTLFRVVMPAPADEAAAYDLRDRVAAVGYADARVVRTF